MKELRVLFVTALTLFVLSEARPGVVTQNPVELENPVNAEENHVRVRRRGYFDYGEYMSNFWKNMNKCANCKTVNIGNGYKNWNEFTMGKRQNSNNQNNGMLNIGNGYKNQNRIFLGPNSPNQGIVSIGNGSKNTNIVNIGGQPGSATGDPFTGSFWED